MKKYYLVPTTDYQNLINSKATPTKEKSNIDIISKSLSENVSNPDLALNIFNSIMKVQDIINKTNTSPKILNAQPHTTATTTLSPQKNK